MMKLMLVAGARPNFMKIAALIEAIEAHNSAGGRINYVLVHTGQHYDDRMSEVFFRELGLPEADVNLGVGSSSHASQTAAIMTKFEPVLLHERPDVLVIVGDVNSTVACSLVASKTVYPSKHGCHSRPIIAHVEAGLRSFDRSMPEEINRVVTDTLSDFLFITEKTAEENLIREGVDQRKIHFVGNTMVDTLLRHSVKAADSDILRRLGISSKSELDGTVSPYGVVTLHRPSNVDHYETFRGILEALAVLGKTMPVFFPVHPRTIARMREFEIASSINFKSVADGDSRAASLRGIVALEPLSYFDFLCLISKARIVLTDSGGIQEETTVLGIPCLTLRENTERPVTITEGTNVLVGTNKEAIVRHALKKIGKTETPKRPELWDGHAADRIIDILTNSKSIREPELMSDLQLF
jgi:UDP-N-acetylglucosamine 2-epimerase (non-hydrolysing)